MKDYFYLIPIALGIGLTALAAFMWSLKNGQYDDLEGAAQRILLQEDDAPIRVTLRQSASSSLYKGGMKPPEAARPACCVPPS